MRRRVFLASVPGLLFTVQAEQAGESISALEHRVFEAINFQRTSWDAEPLIWNTALARSARAHSRRMLDVGFFGHSDPEYGGVGKRLTQAGIAWGRCGENLFSETNFTDPVSIAIVEWMHSPGHRRNLLNSEFVETGVGAARNGEGSVYVTQQFLTPPACVEQHPR